MELTMSELDLLKRDLFGPGSDISDIKFYPGESRECSIDEIAATIRAAFSSVENGGGRDIDATL